MLRLARNAFGVYTVKTVNVRLHVLALMRVACGGEVVEPHLLSCRTLDVATIFATCFACNSRFSFCDFATEKLSSLKLFHCFTAWTGQCAGS